VTSDYGGIRSYDASGNVLGELKASTSNLIIEACMASPAVSDGKLLVRTASQLYCISP
jgi:L-asparaginase II